jgi:hypothetical protein
MTTTTLPERTPSDLSPEAQKVLASILSLGTGVDEEDVPLQCRAPGPQELYAFCDLLALSPKEEQLQGFLTEHPGFLMGLFGMNDAGDLAIITKPKVGTKYVADFAIVQVFQGGAVVFLIEIETAHEPLFTGSLSPARRLQRALTQIDEWKEWINPNKLSFCRDVVDHACRLPLYDPQTVSNSGCRFSSAEHIRQMWDAFGGSADPNVQFAILAGRWGLLSREEKNRFMSKFRGWGELSVFTFDQVARQANYRMERGY